MLINYKSNFFVLIFSILIFTFSCKQENAEPEPKIEKKVIEPIKIETHDFSDISSTGVKLFGKINYLNEEEILDAGFIISTINESGNKGVEKEYSIGKNVSIGEVSYVYKPVSPLEQNATHSYQFYIRTIKNYYKGEDRTFVLNNLRVKDPLQIFSYGLDTLSVSGDFEELNDNYRLQASGSFTLFSIPFSISPDKKSLTCIVAHSKNPANRDDLILSIVRKGENKFSYQQRVATIQYVPRLEIRSLPNTPYDHIEFYSNNLGELHDKDNRLKIIINDIELPYERFIRIHDIDKLKGITFKIGFKNAKETVMFPNSLLLKNPSTIKAQLTRKVVHPTDSYRLQSEEYFHYFFSSIGNQAKIGTHDLISYYDQWDKELIIHQTDIPVGTYDLTVEDRFYKYVYPEKLIVEELAWKEIDKSSAYFGEIITVKGNFISGKDYMVFNQNDDMLGIYTAGSGVLNIEVTNLFANINKLKIGYPYKQDKDKIIPYTQPFVSKGFTFDTFYPKRGMKGDILTIEGKGIAYAEEFLLGDQVLTPIIINKNKVTFSIPSIQGVGKMRINYRYNNEYYQSNEYFEVYEPN